MNFYKEILRKVRNLKVHISSPIKNNGDIRLVRITRLAKDGFTINPYFSFKENAYTHSGKFIDVTIKHLDTFIEKVTKSKVIIPDDTVNLFEGCHCFCYKFDLDQAKQSGNLYFREWDKANIAYLPSDEVVWVNNIRCTKHSPLGTHRYVNHITAKYINPDNGEQVEMFKELTADIDWVKMPLSLAVKRTDKHLIDNKKVDEQISQIYLTKEQINKLISNKFIF
ncbi:hypothetical protein BKP35_16340 [Anaerobacillus arseniciselenatis]|uniref:Uncharacterized protein n=1 Tax=Anaerobacillus arseniciselenatis TaxID=85682 RepID=A0A1S2LBL3_9BACI|nr:hypothetical protein [Anaerobacillus arseniciselenatis]OIJ09423.1 hypothetical protein BKP35_16340 [Anaerobacillus arseniciselenatis]